MQVAWALPAALLPFLLTVSRAAQCEGNSVSAGAHTSFPAPTLFHPAHFHLDFSFFTRPIFTWLFLFHSAHFKSEGCHSVAVCFKLQGTPSFLLHLAFFSGSVFHNSVFNSFSFGPLSHIPFSISKFSLSQIFAGIIFTQLTQISLHIVQYTSPFSSG